MRDRWRRYVSGDPLPSSAAAALLRFAFAASFGAQTGLALVVGVMVRVLTETPAQPSLLLGVVLAVLGLLQGPAGFAAGLAPLPEPERVRAAALQRTLFAAVLLSTPAWYLAFLIATGGGGWPFLALIGLIALYWFAGILLATRLGARAASD